MEKKTESLDAIRHSLSHILAAVVLQKYPDTLLGIGPTTENGFYYDFLFTKSPSDADLSEIEKMMKELIKQKLEFTSEKITPTDAKKLYKDQPFKLELIEELKELKEDLTIYRTGTVFYDLCRGGHIKNTSEIPTDGFKLWKIAGAYWRGSEKNKMLTRIYGLAFQTKKELTDYLNMLEEAQKRDHRKLGKDLDLFFFSPLVGKGLPLWTEKGATVRRELERFIQDEEIRRGYKHVITPDLASIELYKTSGHYPYYKDSMYAPIKIEEEEYMLRPMTCPHHFEIYRAKPRSYKELPFRIAELAKLYRYEKSGELSGMMRVRSFCLADAHIICRDAEQAAHEVHNVLDLIEDSAQAMGLEKGTDFWYRLSLGERKNTKKYFEDDAAWDKAEKALRGVLKERKCTYIEMPDEAAFYGPKIDIQMKNILGKDDTAFTVQYDFVMPKRFQLTYIDETGKEKEPIVVHRSSIGAIERIFALLIEHYAGAFPLWLAPMQVRVLPIGEKHEVYAKKIVETLKKENVRAELDSSGETLGKRIRESEMQKIPYTLVLGDKEIEADSVNIRSYKEGQLGTLTVEAIKEKILREIKEKKI